MDLFHRQLMNGFACATLELPSGYGEGWHLAVQGGLMSGLRTTSEVGSDWNGVLVQLSADLKEKSILRLTVLWCFHVHMQAF